jgi:TolA-binding protein
MDSIETIILALIAAVFSTKGWDYFNGRFLANKEEKKEDRADTNLYRDDLRSEVNRLREEMIALYADRDAERKENANQFAQLKEQLAVFRTRVEFLEKEISSLEAENKMLRQQLKEKE